MELYIGGTAQGKKAYVTQVRGIEEARIWDNFEEWFREKLQESAPKSLSPEAESMAYLEKHPDTVIICDEVGNGIVPLDSFERLLVAAVVHGGTIMALLSHYCGGDYFSYQVKNAEGYHLRLSLQENKMELKEKV